MPRVLHSSYDELIEKAQKVFWLKGFKGISVKDLSTELDVSQNVIYNKYSKDMLFLGSLNYYTSNYSDPFLKQLRETTEGLDSLRAFFYTLIDALLDKSFPRSCLMVNTIVELRNENSDVVRKYDDYLKVLKDSYLVVLDKAYNLGQFKKKDHMDAYADFLLGLIFSMSILYKIHTRASLRKYIDEQLELIR